MKPLDGKKILLGVSSGIAAYKIPNLVRKLRKEGATVHVILTENAEYLVSKKVLEVLSKNKVYSRLFGNGIDIPHIELLKEVDLFLIAPATANTIGKISNGIADDLISTIFLANKAPVIVCPSMNELMWKKITVSTNVRRLRRYGIKILGPVKGEFACGSSGVGRLLKEDEIVEGCIDELTKKDLKKKKILITSGPTKEFFDPIRYISNSSSGKTGYNIAKKAALRGADVILVNGAKDLPQSKLFKQKKVVTAKDMQREVQNQIGEADVFISVAAVSDFKPVNYSSEKIKKENIGFSFNMELNIDILKSVSSEKRSDQIFIGFALETENMFENAQKKMIEKNLDYIVINKPFNLGSDTGSYQIYGKDNHYSTFENISKADFADKLLDLVR